MIGQTVSHHKILERLGVPQGGTVWSAVYDLKARGVYVCLNGAYSNAQYVVLQYTEDP